MSCIFYQYICHPGMYPLDICHKHMLYIKMPIIWIYKNLDIFQACISCLSAYSSSRYRTNGYVISINISISLISIISIRYKFIYILYINITHFLCILAMAPGAPSVRWGCRSAKGLFPGTQTKKKYVGAMGPPISFPP